MSEFPIVGVVPHIKGIVWKVEDISKDVSWPFLKFKEI